MTNDMDQVVRSPFVSRALTVLALVAGAVVVSLGAWHGLTALLATFMGVLLAVMLRSLAQLVQRWRPVGNYKALAVVCGVIVVIVVGSFALLAAPLGTELAELWDTLPRALARLRDQVQALPLGQRLMAQIGGSSPATGLSGQAAQHAFFAVSSAVSLIGYAVLLSFVGLFLAAEPALYRRGVVRLWPLRMRPRMDDVLLEVGERLQAWLLGRAALMAVVAIATWVGLLALGIPLAMALAVLAGVLTFIPNFGPVIAAVPAMLLALLESPTDALYVAGLYLSLQMVESYTLEPYVMRKADDMAPALVIAGQLFLGVTLGSLGLILATPLLVVLVVLVQRLYIEDVLGDRAPDDAPADGG